MTDDIDDDAEAKDRITSITVMACCSTNCWQVKMEKSHIAPQNHLLDLGLKLQKELKKHHLDFDRTWNSQLWLNEAIFHILGVEVTMIYLEKDELTFFFRLSH